MGAGTAALFWGGQLWEEGPEALIGNVLLRWVKPEPEQVEIEGQINLCLNPGLPSFWPCGLQLWPCFLVPQGPPL